MPVLICPVCGAENPISGEKCLKCDATLDGVTPLDAPVEGLSGDESLGSPTKDEQDLPGLLQSLKDEGDIGEVEESLQNGLASNDDLSDIFAEKEASDEEVVPDWLERIRQRAKEEPDAIGDVTQKISAALETIADDKDENKHDDFQSWIENIRKPGSAHSEDQPANELKKENLPSRLSDEDWLMRIRKAEGKLPEGPDPTEQKGNSLLQWLIALEEGRETPSKLGDETSAADEEGDEFSSPITSGDYQVVNEQTQKIATPFKDVLDIDRLMVDISDEEQEQVNLFETVVTQENQAGQQHRPLRKIKHWIWRLVISLILISGLTASLLVWDNADISGAFLSPQNAAFLSWSEARQPGGSLLFIVDFQPGYFSEIMQISKPILGMMLEKDMEISLLSTTPSGELLFENLLAESTGEELAFTDLGYLPMSSLAAYGIANHVENELLQTPESPIVLPAEGYDGILLLSDQAEDVQIWVEQLTALMPETQVLLLLTSQAGPLSLPYWESGQVDGMISGVVEAAAFESAVSGQTVSPVGMRAYQLGSGLMVLMLLLGLTLKNRPDKDDIGEGAQ